MRNSSSAPAKPLAAATEETTPRFRELLEKARDNMVELGELSREEANKVSDYLISFPRSESLPFS